MLHKIICGLFCQLSFFSESNWEYNIFSDMDNNLKTKAYCQSYFKSYVKIVLPTVKIRHYVKDTSFFIAFAIHNVRSIAAADACKWSHVLLTYELGDKA